MSEDFEALVVCPCDSRDVEVTGADVRHLGGDEALVRTVIYFTCCMCGLEAEHHQG